MTLKTYLGRTVRGVLALLFVALAAPDLAGCDRAAPGGTNSQNGNEGNSNHCPAALPDHGTPCTDPAATNCSYVVEVCPCDTYDLHSSCSCDSQEWYCSREYDCYVRCGDAGI